MQPEDDVDEGGLAGSASADDGHRAAPGDDEVDGAEHVGVAVWVAEGHLLQHQAVGERQRRAVRLGVCWFAPGREHLGVHDAERRRPDSDAGDAPEQPGDRGQHPEARSDEEGEQPDGASGAVGRGSAGQQHDEPDGQDEEDLEDVLREAPEEARDPAGVGCLEGGRAVVADEVLLGAADVQLLDPTEGRERRPPRPDGRLVHPVAGARQRAASRDGCRAAAAAPK